ARWRAGDLARELDRCAARLLGGIHPQARLVALLAHRGFAEEADALTHVDAASLMATRAADEATSSAPAVPRHGLRWSWTVAAALALGAGLVAWLLRF
ncbi:MAG TPA: serine/threonine protein kinase, partial [Anaeromyxobacteraceae bacterium]|nr:serine/threonine protein kinase [Anaeromyxobacteraceae bacterium]